MSADLPAAGRDPRTRDLGFGIDDGDLVPLVGAEKIAAETPVCKAP
ncbi:hypothetical protein [Siculibacillus lacustris]|nr:hypothetical protein [Siculibacillus lacustris]